MTDATQNQWAMRDPLTQYARPPFPRQPMDAPGTTDQMTPAPNHGETSYKGLGRMEGRKALITGGDSGIGRATAIAYMREGAEVAINYLQEEASDVEGLKKLFEAEGKTLHTFPGDLTEEGFCTSLVKDAAGALGGLDVLVINAGKQTAQESIFDITTEQFDRTYKTNCYAMFWLAKAAIPLMPKGAAIITTTSIQGSKPSANLLDYASTKWAIIGFTKSLAKQMTERGIRVNGVAPGPVWTPLQPSGGQPQDVIENFGDEVPYGRPAQPAELAPAYVYLATQESGYVTGEVIGVTGGNPTA
ncbi:SDR family oxidoreductase [Parvularcula dongshanensis]|uniref:Uncharacterized oxidoreductase YghA n=1 Tax=Parvularcula dongshanensis TaxID=1173995 RepID=A0A840I0C5_9PROT|nr:SDR family oxidoreductase [Parvularcula dongshanensis]MBB4657795.1 hypothetical protein [Parvularcula dongshanensis]